MKSQIQKTQKLLASVLLGGTVFAPITAFASSDSTGTSTQVSRSINIQNDLLDTDPQLLEKSTTTENTPKHAIISNVTEEVGNNDSSASSSDEIISDSQAPVSSVGVTDMIASSTLVQEVPDLPVVTRAVIAPVPAPLPSSFKQKPTLRLAPETPIYIPTIAPPPFGRVEQVDTSLEGSTTDKIASSTIDISPLPEVGSEDDATNSSSTVPDTTSASSTDSEVASSSEDMDPVLPIDPGTSSPIPSSDTSAVVTKIDDSSTFEITPIAN
jgi:hypothetical protein